MSSAGQSIGIIIPTTGKSAPKAGPLLKSPTEIERQEKAWLPLFQPPRWIIERSTDLENFTEIYRYDGPTSTSTSVAGISAVVGATSITVTDTNPPSPNVFYRFGAQTAP